MKKDWLLLSVVLAASLVFAACGTRGPDTIRVGLIAELTGDIPAVGASCKNAAELAVQEINDAGGLEVGGRKYKVELFTEDNTGKVDQSASVAQKLITQQNVVAIIGPNASRYAIAASEVAEAMKVVLISPWSTSPKTTLDALTGRSKQYVFRAAFTDPFQGQIVAKFALENLKANKVAVLYDEASDYNKGIAEIFRQTYEENGGQVVAFETYRTGDQDFTKQLGKIKDAQPDAIYLPNYYTEVPLQIQQAHSLGITVPFLGSDSWGSAELIELCGSDCEGYYFSTHYAADNASPAATKFIEAYKAKYSGTPDDVAALTYDSFGLLWKALQSAGKIDRQAVRNALAKTTDFEGVTGVMKFLEGSGDPIKSAVILQIQNGKFVFFANAEP